MSEVTLSERMNALRDELQLRYPDRVVTRSLMDPADRESEDLDKGVYTCVSAGESGYQNLNGREAQDGTHRALLALQKQLPEKASGEDVEEAEFAMVEEIKAFMRALPTSLCCLVMTGFVQSQQLDAPYAWAVISLEWKQ